MDKLLLIDGNSLTYRAYFGSSFASNNILRNSNGIPINAILTLNLMLSKAFKKYKPTHVFVAFDAGKITKRHEKLNSYKGKRNKTPEDLIAQFPIIKQMLSKWGIKHYEVNGIEADDIIATLAIKHHKNIEINLLSSDKDLYQLIDENISMIVPQNGAKEDKFITYKNFYDLHGYYPGQVVDLKALAGDPSDNLPGISGIGIKGAIKLLAQYNSLELIYENMDSHTITIQKKLQASKKMAFLCKNIAILYLDVKIPFKISEMAFPTEISDELIKFFKFYELNSLVKKFKNKVKNSENSSQLSLDHLLF